MLCGRKSVLLESEIVSLLIMNRLYTYYVEKTINYPLYRWVVLVLTMALYVKRILSTHGFYLLSYTLGLYLLNLLLGFLSPLVILLVVFHNQEVYDDDTAELPTRDATEYRPFIRRVPEFKFWLFLISMVYAQERKYAGHCFVFLLDYLSVLGHPCFLACFSDVFLCKSMLGCIMSRCSSLLPCVIELLI